MLAVPPNTRPIGQIRLGTRASKLALCQATVVQALLHQHHPTWTIALVPITTTGDRVTGPLAAHGGKALYVKELEEALLSGSIDLAVHSTKDLPGELPRGLTIFAVPEREDPRDALVTRDETGCGTFAVGARIGTSSVRRTYQLQGQAKPPQQAKPVGSPPHARGARWGDAQQLQGLASRSDLVIEPIRGNVDTRVRKVAAGEYAALVMAMAGLKRLGIAGDHLQIMPFPVDEMIPAIGQGALAIEGRTEDAALATLVRTACHHEPSGIVVAAERAVLRAVGGDCYTPLAAHATLEMGTVPIPKSPSFSNLQMGTVPIMRLRGWLATPDGVRAVRAEQSTQIGTGTGAEAEAAAAALGRAVGEELKEKLSASVP